MRTKAPSRSPDLEELSHARPRRALDTRTPVVAPEDRASGHEQVGPGFAGRSRAVSRLIPPSTWTRTPPEESAHLLDAAEGIGHEGLPRVAGVDRHAEDEIHAVGRRDRVAHCRLGIERETDAEPERPRRSDRTWGVVAGLDVERDAVSAGARDRLEVTLRLGHHQVAVEPRAPATNERRDGREHDRPHGDLGDEVPVAHVEVEDLRARATTAPRAARPGARSRTRRWKARSRRRLPSHSSSSRAT